LILRPEKPKDYNQIAQLNFWAFTNWKPRNTFESEMVVLARQSADFDADLSIVAEENGQIIGHVLLMPSDFIVMGEKAKGVLLGPIAVNPEYQKKGIGRKLIEQGHKTAKSKGFEFSLLCGHPSYYPKFGYLQKAFSVRGTKIEKKDYGHIIPKNVAFRPLLKTDASIVCTWQKDIRKNDSLAILFEKNIVGFHPNTTKKQSIIITKDDIPIGFVKCLADDMSNIDILFFDEKHIEDILHFIYRESKSNTLSLKQPPEVFEKLLAKDKFIVTDLRAATNAFMICPLNTKSIINEYINKTSKNEIPIGVVCYPPYCDVDI